jgi:hypothetical protein
MRPLGAIAIVFSCCDLFILCRVGINYFGLFQPAKNSAKAKNQKYNYHNYYNNL